MSILKLRQSKVFVIMMASCLLALWVFISPNNNQQLQAEQQALLKGSERLQPYSMQIAAKLESAPPVLKPDHVVVASEITNPSATVQWGLAEVIREQYLDETRLDDFQEEEWDEQAYIEQKRLAYKSMTSSEVDAKQSIDTFNVQLSLEMDHAVQSDSVSRQLVEYFIPAVEAQGSKTTNLSCVSAVCRVVLDVADEFAQYEAIDAINGQIEGVQKTIVDIEIQPDERRFVTLYFVRAAQLEQELL